MQSQRKKMPPTGESSVTLPMVVMIGGFLMVLAVAAMYGWNWYSDRGSAGTPVAANASSTAGTTLPAGPIQVAGVEVLQPVADAGQVPLNTGVQRLWRLRNTGTTRVTIGLPSIEVLEGC